MILLPIFTNESIDIIYNKVQELSCTYPIIKAHDLLSAMSTDVLANCGKYLTKEESFSLGHVNSRLFIETNKKAFIMSRRSKQDEFHTNDKIMAKIIKDKPASVSHYYPYIMHVSGSYDLEEHDYNTQTLTFINDDKNKQLYFDPLFKAITQLHMTSESLVLLKHIPMKLVFDKQSNQRNGDLDVVLYQADHEDTEERIWPLFNNNYQNFFKSECNNNIDNIRRINKLTIDSEYGHDIGAKKCLMILNYNFKQLDLYCNMSIKTLDEFGYIFHNNLKTLKLHNNIEISPKILQETDDPHHCNIETLYICDNRLRMSQFLKPTFKLGVLSNVMHLDIVYRKSINNKSCKILKKKRKITNNNNQFKHYGWLAKIFDQRIQSYKLPSLQTVNVTMSMSLTLLIQQFEMMKQIKLPNGIQITFLMDMEPHKWLKTDCFENRNIHFSDYNDKYVKQIENAIHWLHQPSETDDDLCLKRVISIA